MCFIKTKKHCTLERKRIVVKLITFKDIIDLNVSYAQCYKWAEEMIKNKSKADLPPKISIKQAEGAFCNVMPCIVRNSVIGDVGGVKVVTRYPDRKPCLDAKLLLFDVSSGQYLAMMDADWITTMRTGAVAAHSILLFAKKDFYEIGMLGLGNTACATLLILASQIGNRKLHIKLLKYKGQEMLFVERFAGYSNFAFSFVDNVEAVVKCSDVVISAVTYAADDFCEDQCFAEGVLVVPIHTRGFTNCDLFFDKVYADDTGHVEGFKNFSKFKCFAEVSDVINGMRPGRENDRERILAYNIGVSIHDINFAAHIYHMLNDSSFSKSINMIQPTDKFWV